MYVLDANVFIEASRRYYAFDLAPGFWTSLESHVENGSICSIDRIKSEIDRGRDELTTWINDNISDAFESTNTAEIATEYAAIVQWVNDSTHFLDSAKTEFASVADGWLVAYTRSTGKTVVTHETLDPQARRRVFIPNVCEQFNVAYIDTFELMRRLQIQLN